MTPFEILCSVTKPTTEAEVLEILRVRYGGIGRENVNNDDPLLVERAIRIVQQANLAKRHTPDSC